MVPTDRAHLLLFIAQISWANEHGSRYILELYLDPSHPNVLRELRKRGYDDSLQFQHILETLGYLSDQELTQVATALLETPPF